MPILTVGGVKGGTGKTTLATNLAVIRSKKKKVLLVDGDEQKSSTLWVNHREALGVPTKWTTVQIVGKAIYTEIPKIKAHIKTL